MSGSTFGKYFRVTTWGESHGPATGAVIDGCPAGLSLCPEDIRPYMEKRRPNASAASTPRREADAVEILSGVYEGVTTGTPISLLIRNTDARPADYDVLRSQYRPGHADETYDRKYGIRDIRGGGRASARETAARVAAGAVAGKILREFGVSWNTSWQMGSPAKPRSTGGVITVTVDHLPAGLGEPVFDKLDAVLSQAVMSIGAIKGVEIGAGFAAADATGIVEDGGILGGISTGRRLTLRAAVKPCPTAAFCEALLDDATRDDAACDEAARDDAARTTASPVALPLRYDTNITPRAAAVAEAMVLLTLTDALLANTASRMDYLKRIYPDRSKTV